MPTTAQATAFQKIDPQGDVQGCTNAAGAECAGRAVITSYRYDAANRLIEETSPSGTTNLYYDPSSGRLAQLTDGNSHEGFCLRRPGKTDPAQPPHRQITLNLRLSGQYEDQESGIYYNFQGDYDPNTERYLSSDPIGL